MSFDGRSAAVLVACARHGSIGRAAASLNISQPALTRILKRIEDSFGSPLFERTSRGVTANAYGEAVLPYAELVVSESGNAAEVVRQMLGSSMGIVRVGGVSSVIERYIVAATCEMHKSVPNVAFHIFEEIEDELLASLKQGKIDIAVSPESYLDSEVMLATTTVFHDRICVYARRQHPIFSSRSIALEAIAQMEWAGLPDTTPFHREWRRRFQRQGLEPRPPVISARSVRAILSALLASDLLICMPSSLARTEIDAGNLVRVNVPELEWNRTLQVYRRKRGLLPAPVATFVRHLAKLAAD